MYNVGTSRIRALTPFEGYQVPSALTLNCPFCGTLGRFGVFDYNLDGERMTILATGECPECVSRVRIWFVDILPENRPYPRKNMKIYIEPPPYTERSPHIDLEHLPARIRRAYEEALNVFNSGAWPATTTCCRRTLEGIIAALLPPEDCRGPLGRQLEKIKDQVDLAKPLITLSDALRQGGNIGAHFNLEGEPDKGAALAAIDLVEYLLEYVFVLPKKIETLGNKIKDIVTPPNEEESQNN